MYTFPRTLEVGKSNSGTTVFGYRCDSGHFRYDGFYDYDAEDPNIGLPSARDGHYLDNLNSALSRAADAAIACARETISRITGQECSYGHDDNKYRAQVVEAVAHYFIGEFEYLNKHGTQQASELTTRYNAVLALSLDQCARLLPPFVTQLDAVELKVLMQHEQDYVCRRLPQFNAGFQKLGWGSDFYRQLEQDGNLVRFYVLLKELRQKYLNG